MMGHTVILVPGEDAISVLVPAMPGCFSVGRTREEALAHVQEAIRGWIETETEQGRTPLAETPAVVIAGVAQALEIIDKMRQAGEAPVQQGYALEVVTVEAPHPVPA